MDGTERGRRVTGFKTFQDHAIVFDSQGEPRYHIPSPKTYRDVLIHGIHICDPCFWTTDTPHVLTSVPLTTTFSMMVRSQPLTRQSICTPNIKKRMRTKQRRQTRKHVMTKMYKKHRRWVVKDSMLALPCELCGQQYHCLCPSDHSDRGMRKSNHYESDEDDRFEDGATWWTGRWADRSSWKSTVDYW